MSSIEHVIVGRPRLQLRHAFRELRAYWRVAVAFAERDIRVKYKQASLGVFWAIIQPLAYMGVFVLALGHLAKVPGGGTPYAAFALSALVPWTFLQTGVQFGANALLTDSALVRKVYFPRELPVIGCILGAGVDLAIGLALFFVVGPLLGAHASPVWLLAPLLGAILAVLAAGVALAVAAVNVHYRDFRHALPFALQLWLFASPVAYPLSVVPKGWRTLYVATNPAAGVLDAFRRTLAHGDLPDPQLLVISAAGAVAAVWLGYLVFKTLEPNFADVV